MSAAVADATPGWQRHAACRGHSGVFYPPAHETAHTKARREAAAKRICGGCPVRQACAAEALATGEPFGIWGGMTPEERWARLHPDCRRPPRGWRS